MASVITARRCPSSTKACRSPICSIPQLQMLCRLTDLGNTVIIIEHHLDVVKTADWVIDLGPEGGAQGGRLMAAGTPEQIAGSKKSYTGQALAQVLLKPSSRQLTLH